MKNFKKSIALLIALCMMFTTFTLVNVSAEGENADVITVLVNGNQLNFDVNPITESDRTLVPMRAIFEALGATVTWDDTTQTATAKKDDTVIAITIDNNILYKNGSVVKLDVPARMVGDRTLVPIRAVSEGLGADVKWDEANLQVIITTVETPSVTTAPTDVTISSPTPSASTVTSVTLPTLAPQPTSDTTPRPLTGDEVNCNKLTDDDMQKLKDMGPEIRYTFEQYALSSLVAYTDDLYTKLIRYPESVKVSIENTWDYTVAKAAMYIQMESETVYIMNDAANAESVQGLVSIYSDIIKASGLSSQNYIENIYVENIDNSTLAAITTMRSADPKTLEDPIQCKYMAMVANSSQINKYYTVEADINSADTYFFCFVNYDTETKKTNRGTISTLSKNDSYNSFKKLIKEDFAK